MAIDFSTESGKLLLEYYPELVGPDAYIDRLRDKGSRWLFNVFLVKGKDYYDTEGDYVRFVIGEDDGNYYKLDSSIIQTKHVFYFEKTITLHKSDFVGERKSSILRLLDAYISSDIKEVFIDSQSTDNYLNNHMPYKLFRKYVASIPHNKELDEYIDSRAAVVLQEVFPEVSDRIIKHEQRVESIHKRLMREKKQTELHMFYKFDREKMFSVKTELEYLIKNSRSIAEGEFQEKIAEIICFIFPKYIYSVREVTYKGIDGHDKRPDFVLIDFNGNVDFLEIKKPDIPIINKTKYRNNYSASHDLSGAVQQVEKYITCVQRVANTWEEGRLPNINKGSNSKRIQNTCSKSTRDNNYGNRRWFYRTTIPRL